MIWTRDMSSAADYSGRAILLRSNSLASDGDLERGAAQSPKTSTSNGGALASDLFKRRFTSHHRISSSSSSHHPNDDSLAQGEWALLLLGVATGFCVAFFNRGVCISGNHG